MNASTFDAMTPLQRLMVERGLTLAKDLEATSNAAPDGQIIDRCETLLLANGREYLRMALEETLRDRVETLGKTGRPAGPAPAVRPAATRRGRRDR